MSILVIAVVLALTSGIISKMCFQIVVFAGYLPALQRQGCFARRLWCYTCCPAVMLSADRDLRLQRQ